MINIRIDLGLLWVTVFFVALGLGDSAATAQVITLSTDPGVNLVRVGGQQYCVSDDPFGSGLMPSEKLSRSDQ